jgi:hypothetical protein
MKRLLHICLAVLGSATISQAQNVGIAEAAPNSKLDIVQTETTGNTIEANHNVTTNGSSAVWVRNLGTSRALHVQNLSVTSDIHVARFLQLGNGAAADGVLIEMDAATVASTAGLFLVNNGLGFGSYNLINNPANTNPAIVSEHPGSGEGLFILQSGTGDGVYNDVTGGAGIINVVRNNNIGILNNMSVAGGTGSYSYLAANNGTGYNVLATDNIADPSLGAGGDVYAFFSNINTATPTGGGTVFGALLAGNQYGVGHGALITHSGAQGRNAEFNITNPNNPNEAIFAVHSGQGSAIVAQNQNNALAGVIRVADFAYTGTDVDDHFGIEGASTPAAGWGIGVLGTGNFYGVVSQGDFTATGAKAFTIDHPADPANKMLKHFAIESNEVLNMYRGVIELDANGNATVELPDYFQMINKDFSYQLTAIGSAQHPYVKEEIEGNTFVISGAPNTKVSWTVFADRNDVYMQTYPEKGLDVVEKEGSRKGKYVTPELYNQPKEMGLFYNPKHEGAKANTKLELKSNQAAEKIESKKSAPKKELSEKDALEPDVTSSK